MTEPIVYFNQQYMPLNQVCLSPEDRGFMFADGIYEVIRSYNGRLFMLGPHIKRLNYGARCLRLSKQDFSEMKEVTQTLLEKNNLQHEGAVVYIQVTRGSAPRSHRFPAPDTPLTQYASAKPFTRDDEKQQQGVRTVFVPDTRWARCDIKSIMLLPNALASQQAYERGADEALFVRDGSVLEGSRSSFFGVWGGTLVTPPTTNYILGSITRQVVIELCRENAIPLQVRSLEPEALFNADELMLAGTTIEITPITHVDDRPINGGTPGPITRQLQKQFHDLVA